MYYWYKSFVSSAMLINCFVSTIHGHGRLVDPPGRASMWRYGYNTPVDFNDNQQFCGGYNVQHFKNGGKCGVCGDEYGTTQLNQPPGVFATGTISKKYTMNSNVTMWFEITASHRGYLEFRLCPNNDVTKPATQECLNQYILSDSKTGGTKFYFNYGTVGTYGANIVLPQGLICSQCVLQWRYRTGNSWGCTNDDPSIPENCGIGFGRQEEFYACADVSILSSDSDNILPSTTKTSRSTFSTTKSTSTKSDGGSSTYGCFAIGDFKGNPGIDLWCKIQCSAGYCPSSHCNPGCIQSASQPSFTTPTSALPTTTTTTAKTTMSSTLQTTEAAPTIKMTCIGAGAWKDDTAMAAWCDSNCKLGHCPPSHCQCSKDGSLVDSSYGLGDKCVTVMNNISSSYKMYMDLWCKNNCPSFGCWNIPDICQC